MLLTNGEVQNQLPCLGCGCTVCTCYAYPMVDAKNYWEKSELQKFVEWLDKQDDYNYAPVPPAQEMLDRFRRGENECATERYLGYNKVDSREAGDEYLAYLLN